MNKFLCWMWGHHYYYSYYRVYINHNEFIDERFKCKHCGAKKL